MIYHKKLNWDTEFFGYAVYSINKNVLHLESALKDLFETKKASLIYLFSKHKSIDSETLKKYNGEFVDTKIVYKKILAKKKIDQTINPITKYRSAIISPDLYNLALESGKYSRFKTDTRLPKKSFEKMYKSWLVNSINRSIADEIFICSQETNILGFVTVSKKKDYGEIGLIAVDSRHTGLGIGKSLLKAVENYLIENEIFELFVPTQEINSKACRFYENNGFSENSSTAIYHFIKKNNDKIQ